MKKSVGLVVVFCLMGIISIAQEELPVSFRPAPEPDSEVETGGRCSCEWPDQPLLWEIRWIVATCRSGCTRGIGFRCGREGYIFCKSGKFYLCARGVHCPVKEEAQNPRAMRGQLSFFDNQTVKIRFLNALPREEADNRTFEVEEEDTVFIPESVLIGGKRYAAFTVPAGSYDIDVHDGEFGSVTLPMQFVKK